MSREILLFPTQATGNSPWLLCLWTESLPPHVCTQSTRFFHFCWWLLSVRRATEGSIPEPAVTPVGVYREERRKNKIERKEPGEFTVQVLPFYCGFCLGLTNPPLPCQLQTGWLNTNTPATLFVRVRVSRAQPGAWWPLCLLISAAT